MIYTFYQTYEFTGTENGREQYTARRFWDRAKAEAIAKGTREHLKATGQTNKECQVLSTVVTCHIE